ncbi:MAG: hydroxymethylpyrimidine/phosphomethylpyrimidine kinase [Bacteroidetes bacterium]|nr:hydroxymethylpyrimidine/phosphomethylpyrimidine kinase [Bacteroidota bacterium]
MHYNRPIVLSIAGFDPSGGAGLLADIKTIEQHHCLGMGVISALTVQTENQFISVEWLSAKKIMEQLKPLLKVYEVNVFKIGIIESLDTLLKVATFIKKTNPNAKIVWDTVLSATAGKKFFNELNKEKLNKILKLIYLITPNANEVKLLAGIDNEKKAAIELAKHCKVLLKGGHTKRKGIDTLYDGITVSEIKPHIKRLHPKHGTGCILSSAITCSVAKNKDSLFILCTKAKLYVESIMATNRNLLAYHVQ